MVGAVAAATAQPAGAQTVVFSAPVDAPVLDPYRPPENGFGEGNRGIEHDTATRTRVDAAGPGLVVFAGPVAGRSWVTVKHHGGLSTTYGPLAAVAVRTGDMVVRSDRLGSTFGARGDIAGLPEVEQEVRLALGGFPPACKGTAEALLDLVVPESIAFAENAFAAGALVSDLLPS